MGNLLDDLLRSTGVTVAWDAAEDVFPTRAILRFDESFSVDDTGDEIKIGLRFLSGMAGDVRGDSDENRVVTISGDEDTELVTFACGVCFTPRTLTDAGELEGTDALVFLDIPTEGELTLPDPALNAGRVFIVPIAGSGASLRRFGSELINGASSDYAMPADCIMVIATDGTNWVARPIAEPGGGGAEEPAIVWSPVDTLRDNNSDLPADANGDQTSGTAFFVRSGPSCEIVGIRFYWAGTAGQTVKTVLYSAAGAVLKTANVTTAGAGVYTSTFATPYAALSGIQYKAAVYDTAGGKYTKVGNNSATALLVPARPFFGGRRIGWLALGLWLAGDNSPTSSASNEWYLVEPILSE